MATLNKIEKNDSQSESLSSTRSNYDSIEKLEKEHCDDLKKISEIYLLFRDYYYHFKKKNVTDNEIGKLLSNIFQEVYVSNNIFLQKALERIKTLYKLQLIKKTSDKRFQNILLNTIKGNIAYIGRIKDILNDVVKLKKIDKLIQEIDKEKKGIQ